MGTILGLLREQKQASSAQRRAQRQKEWLAALDGLFQQIRSWLAEAQREKLIKVTPGRVQISEETLGTYTAPLLTLTVGTKTIRLKPVGSVIIGADGRVDMHSVNGTYLFLYLADQKKWVHGAGQKPADFPELTEEVFGNLLKRALA